MSIFIFHCRGHPNMTAEHKTTLEITTDKNITQRGDCIVGVRSSKNFVEISEIMKEEMRKEGSKIRVQIRINDLEEIIEGKGSPELDFTDSRAIIIRKSSFICSRTLMINSNKAARDISRDIINLMKNENSVMDVIVQVEAGSIEASRHA